MAGINKCILVGRTGKDVELKYMSNGNAIANVSVAVSESWKDKAGQKQERTEWINVVIFGKLAEIAGQYLTKGTLVWFEGKIRTEKYQDQQGVDKYATKIYADGMQLLDNPNKNNQTQNQASYQAQRPMQKPQSRSQQPVPSFDEFDDDSIPF